MVDVDIPIPNSTIVENSLYKFDKNSTMSVVTEVGTNHTLVAGDIRIVNVSRPILPGEYWWF